MHRMHLSLGLIVKMFGVTLVKIWGPHGVHVVAGTAQLI
jgi:hypothetical protein